MKTFTKFLTMLAVAALFATGCVNEEPPYKEDPNPEPAGTTGYLSIGNLSMTVVYDETEIRPDDTSDETQAARDARYGSRRGQLYRGDPRRRQRAGT